VVEVVVGAIIGVQLFESITIEYCEAVDVEIPEVVDIKIFVAGAGKLIPKWDFRMRPSLVV
jgi:hypothetical protein